MRTAGLGSGTAAFPLRLFWSPVGLPFRLDNLDELHQMYEVVFQEAVHPAELTSFTHGPTLAAC